MLRFSLRSLQNIKHDRVFIVGDKPGWIQNVEYIRYPDAFKRASLNTWYKLLKVCRSNVSQKFILMDDDYMIMKPTVEIPYYSRGTIEEVIRNHKSRTEFYYDLKKTGKIFSHAICFNKVHCPIIYDKKKVLELPKKYNFKGTLHKSLYGNHYKCDPTPAGECKARSWKSFIAKLKRGDRFVSTSPKVEGNPEFKKVMLKKFPEKSCYEKNNRL